MDAPSPTLDGEEVQGQFLSVILDTEPPEGGVASLARPSAPRELGTDPAQANPASALLQDALPNGELSTSGSVKVVGVSNGFMGERATASDGTQTSSSSLQGAPEQEFQTANLRAKEAGLLISLENKGDCGETCVKPSEVPYADHALGLPDASLRPDDVGAPESFASSTGEPGGDLPRDSSRSASERSDQAGAGAAPTASAGCMHPAVPSSEPIDSGRCGNSEGGSSAELAAHGEASGGGASDADPGVGVSASASPRAPFANVDEGVDRGFPQADQDFLSDVRDTVGGCVPETVRGEKGSVAEGQGMAAPGIGGESASARIQSLEAQGVEEVDAVAEEGPGMRLSMGTQGSPVPEPLTENLRPVSDGALQSSAFPSRQSGALPSGFPEHFRGGDLLQEAAEQAQPRDMLQAGGTDGPLRSEPRPAAGGVCSAQDDGALELQDDRQGGAGEGAVESLVAEAPSDVTSVCVSGNEDVEERAGRSAGPQPPDTGAGEAVVAAAAENLELTVSVTGVRAQSLDVRSQMSWITVEEAAERPVSPARDEEERIATVSRAAHLHAP